MRIDGTVAALCLILSAISMTTQAAHAAVKAPEKNSAFDSGSFAGNWVADQCAEGGAALTTHKLNIALEKGTLTVLDKSGEAQPLKLSFSAINEGPSSIGSAAAPSESYTFINGVYKNDQDGSASLKSLKDGASLTVETVDQSLKCHFKRL